jgi:hypothetical protein
MFKPDADPYLGRDQLRRFDLTIVGAMKANTAVAAASHLLTLSPLQAAACEILPQAVSIALSIRELIRQAYLLSGLILIRPLIERTAIISYLSRTPEAVDLWKKGWPHKKRPSLATMLDSMGWSEVEASMGQQICSLFNHVVHGDPLASHWNLIHLETGDMAHASGRITNNPELCDIIAGNTYGQLLLLMATMALSFPDVAEVREAISETIPMVVG